MKNLGTNPVRIISRTLGLAFALVLWGVPAFATPSTFLDVCSSGCTYSTVQSALDTITDSSADKPYTIFIHSGVLLTDLSGMTNGKSYINFVGNGEGVSIWRASDYWFAHAAGRAALLDLTHSSHITIRGLTIDARSNDPGSLDPNTVQVTGVLLDTSDHILFDSAEIQGVYYGIWDYINSTGNLVEMFNSKALATNSAVYTQNARWHIYGSEIKALQPDVSSAIDQAVALDMTAGQDVTVWGSHLHAESSKSGASGIVAALRSRNTSGPAPSVAIIGTQLHLKMTTTTIGSASRPMFAFYLQNAVVLTSGQFSFIGSYLNYESPASISQGRIGGIGYNWYGQTINFVGGGTFDVGGSGGTYRADVVQNGSFGHSPTINIAGSKVGAAVAASGSLPSGLGHGFSTLNAQRGTVTLSNGAAAVTLTTPLPDSVYSATVSFSGAPTCTPIQPPPVDCVSGVPVCSQPPPIGCVSETLYVSSKSSTGFTITSTNPNSTSTVDWSLVR
jgi:hypothetical protein